MCSIEIWYLWYIFYTKFIYILCKFYPLQSFDYSWSNNLIVLSCKRNICFILENFVLSLTHFLVISTATQLSLSTEYKSWNNIDLLTLNQRNSFNVVFQRCFISVETMSINICRLNFHFQPNFNVETTLFYRRWIDVILSTLFQSCLANVETTSINVRQINFRFQPNINVETTSMKADDQRCFNVEST